MTSLHQNWNIYNTHNSSSLPWRRGTDSRWPASREDQIWEEANLKQVSLETKEDDQGPNNTAPEKGLENWHHPVSWGVIPLLVPLGTEESLKWDVHRRVGPCCCIWTGETDPKPHLSTAQAQGGLKGWDPQQPAPAIAEKIMAQCPHHRTEVNTGMSYPSKWNHQLRALISLDFCGHVLEPQITLPQKDISMAHHNWKETTLNPVRETTNKYIRGKASE